MYCDYPLKVGIMQMVDYTLPQPVRTEREREGADIFSQLLRDEQLNMQPLTLLTPSFTILALRLSLFTLCCHSVAVHASCFVPAHNAIRNLLCIAIGS